MSAREEILARVRAARPPAVALPEVDLVQSAFPRSDEPLVARMARMATAGGAHVLTARRHELSDIVGAAHPHAQRVASVVSNVEGNCALSGDPHDLADLDVYVCEGELGVAEDGSVWLTASRLGTRAALFIAAHVVLVLECERIVENLHDAYARIDLAADSFGSFVAGPSKTADIEQALVVGAHGPKGLTLVLVDGAGS